jgi:hypothetical protein
MDISLPSSDQGGAISLDARALSLSPLNSISGEPLLRSQYLQDLSNLLKDNSNSEKDKYVGLVKGMDQHLLDQDNTLERLNTVESMLEDPLDSFLDYTSPEQINSILDEADDKTTFDPKQEDEEVEESPIIESAKPTKRRRKN